MLLRLLASAMLAACETATPTPAVSSAAPKPSGQMTADRSRVETVSLTLSDFHFSPDDLELQRGTPYRLHLVNASTSAHTFASAPFFKAIAVRRSAQGTGAGVPVSPEGIEVGPGEQKDLDFVVATPGSYDFECSKFLHSTLGMTGNIVVR
jgi:uncharacterized cupredoxin-like copper-binding protein